MTDNNKINEYKLYGYFDPDGFDWWIKHMDKDYKITDDEDISFSAKINNDSILEWYYVDTPTKIYKKQFRGNSVFWIEFCETYCKCYDDDDDY